MKKLYFIVTLIIYSNAGFGQSDPLQQLWSSLEYAGSDSAYYVTSMQLGYYYSEQNRDSSIYYYSKALEKARQYDKKLAEASSLSMIGYQLSMKGQFAESLQNLLDAFTILEEWKLEENLWMFSPGFREDESTYRLAALARNQAIYSALMRNTKNVGQEILYLHKSIETAQQIGYEWRIAVSYLNLGMAHLKLGQLDSALFYGEEALHHLQKVEDAKYESNILVLLGNVYLEKGKPEMAQKYYFAGVQSAIKNNNMSYLSACFYRLSQLYFLQNNKDSSLYYAQQTLATSQALTIPTNDFSTGDVYENLYRCYELNNQVDSAYKYLTLALSAKDSIAQNTIQQISDFQNLGFKEQIRLREIEKQQVVIRNRIKTYALLAGLSVLLIIAIFLYKNNRIRRRSNEVLSKQKEEIEQQKKSIEQTLHELKSTQAQLVQSEKMASLGELTAGIAHEIQNPLNFVNNFSEVNIELVEELRSELEKVKMQYLASQPIDLSHIDEAEDLINDIESNQQKINHHGKRADAIVKGMLQHNRSSSGQKELTDINALCDEYMRLAYHGLRAKDKSFNATMETNFDPTLPNINVIPQDIGRVLLNLINNAFYAVQAETQNSASLQQTPQKQPDYKPLVMVATKNMGNHVEIRVKDNGSGIPDSIKEKIFQPFFTTKPTGQGTGLGLSLSYDIVKAHMGEIKVESIEGKGTEFIIQIPLNKSI